MKSVKLMFTCLLFVSLMVPTFSAPNCTGSQNCANVQKECKFKTISEVTDSFRKLDNVYSDKIEVIVPEVKCMVKKIQSIEWTVSLKAEIQLILKHLNLLIVNCGKNMPPGSTNPAQYSFCMAKYHFGNVVAIETCQENPFASILWDVMNKNLTACSGKIGELMFSKDEKYKNALTDYFISVIKICDNYIIEMNLNSECETALNQYRIASQKLILTLSRKDTKNYREQFENLVNAAKRLKALHLTNCSNCVN
ncbi:MAG: hypothetical protein HQM10_15935 [Candidatus Riflebacteria bacterium]|nr:hypothetical protein [Candidatus Riflebacteria bacterium]